MKDFIFKQQKYVDEALMSDIKALETVCYEHEEIALKLEVEYKHAVYIDQKERDEQPSTFESNEFMCYDGHALVGYIGICGFGGYALELNGMVHPNYRHQGIFSALHERVLTDLNKRHPSEVLLLCDANSHWGQYFIEQCGGKYQKSEFEMVADLSSYRLNESEAKLIFKKATNADKAEIDLQNAIYFSDETGEVNEAENTSEEITVLPEDEEKRGFLIYLAHLGPDVVGKVNIQLLSREGGIYGLGIKPEYRGKGLGRSLLLQAMDVIQKNGLPTAMLQVEAENEKALSLYKSCGFEIRSTMKYYCIHM